MRRLSSGRSVAALVGLIAVTGGATGLTATSAAAQEVTLVGATFTPSEVDVATGFGSASIDLALQSDEPIADSFGSCDGDLGTVYATALEGSRPWVAAGERPAFTVEWRGPVTRVSGTPTDGVWRTTASSEVSLAWTGSWTVNRLVDPFSCFNLLEVGPAGEVAVGSPEQPPWKVMQAPLAPIKIVTGAETWTPRVRVTDRLTGAGVPAFMTNPCLTCLFHQRARQYFSVRHPPPRASSSGYWNAPPRLVRGDPAEHSTVVEAWAKRGTRGYSLDGHGCIEPWVKWQASQQFATSGRTVTASGNAWPAPSVYQAANRWIRLQVLGPAGWTDVAGARVRDNGRYTLAWTAPSAGTYQVRVYKAGGMQSLCSTSAGTTLTAVGVPVG